MPHISVSEEIKAIIYQQGKLAREAKASGDINKAEQHLLAAWHALPDPKTEHEFSDSISVALTQFYRDSAQIEKAKKWLVLAKEIYGDSVAARTTMSFINGTLLFSGGEFDAAYAEFDALYKAYGERPFQGNDEKYLEFFRHYQKGRVDTSVTWEAQVEQLSERGSAFSDAGRYVEAIQLWREALDRVPDPRSDWEQASWLNASIADACYQQGQYDEAKSHLFDALNGAQAQGEPFILYLLGKVLWQLQDEDSVEYFLRAYMLDGEEIFREDEDVLGVQALALLKNKGLI